MNTKVNRLLYGTAMCAALAMTPARAQDTTGTPVAEADDGSLNAIVVTAQRRTENLQEVPLSIVAVSGEALQATGVQTLEAVNRLAPNTVIEQVGLFPGAASLSMRGVGYAGIESFTDPDVAVYVNGIYQARNATALTQTLDVSSIEVLRGPQGTLFGRNAYAGAISLQTNRAKLGETSASATATVGNYGLVDADLVGNVGLADTLAARVAVRSHSFDGFWTNNGIIRGQVDPALEGDRIGRERTLLVRPSLRFEPDGDTDIQFIAEFYRQRNEASPIASLPLTPSSIVGLGGSQANPFGDDRLGIPDDGSNPYRVGFSLANRPMDVDQQSYTLDASRDIGVGTIRLLGNIQNTESEIWADTDGSVANLFSSQRAEDYDAKSAELQFVSDFSDRFDLILGGLVFHDEYKTTQLTYTALNANFPPEFSQLNYLSPGSATCTGSSAGVINTGCAYPAFSIAYINNGGKRTAYAAYAQGEYHLTDALSVVAGLRYSYERKYDYYGSNSTLAATNLPRPVDPAAHALPLNTALIFEADPYSDDNWAPRLGVNYKASPDVFLFAFWQRAFKSGGFNASSGDRFAFLTPYGSERVDNFEAGMKTELFDRRVRLNIQGFYGRYSDLQRSQVTQSPSSASGVTNVTANTTDLKSYGIEAEFAARPTSSTTVFTNLGWNKAKYTRYCADLNGAEASATPILAPDLAVCGPVRAITNSAGVTSYIVPQDYSGKRPVRAPMWDITAGITQEFDVGPGQLSATGSVNYRSSVDTDLLNRPYSYRPAMTVFDASLRWVSDDDQFAVSLWGRNLTNRIEVLSYIPVGASFAFGAPTPPRQYGVTASVNF